MKPSKAATWLDILQETNLKVDAEPKEVQKHHVEEEPPLGPSPKDQGEQPWRQYLESRLQAKAKDGPSHPWRKNAPLTVAAFTDGSQAVSEKDDSTSPLQTQTYLHLLKEFEERRKAADISAKRVAKGMLPVEKHVPQREVSLATITSNLAKKWSDSLSEKVDANEDYVRALKTCDDIAVEKMFVDLDPSDPSYWSEEEVEPLDIQRPSAHRLGRRIRIPKAMVRSYVMQDLTYSLDRAVSMFLRRLQFYTDQQKILTGDSIGRRYCLGLKEVARRVKQTKIECLIIAPDIQEDVNSGGLDDRMREMLELTYQRKVPVIFALSRSRIGLALGKHLNISVLGVLDATGAREFLDESVKLADENVQAWLARRGN